MSFGVDSSSQSAHNSDADSRQGLGQSIGLLSPVSRTMPRSDDADRQAVRFDERPFAVDHRRWVRDPT